MRIELSEQRVGNIEPALVTRFRRRAVKRRNHKNLTKQSQFYRWEVRRRKDGKYEVVALQNKAVGKLGEQL